MFRAVHRSSSGALTVFAVSGLHTHVVTVRSQFWVGIGQFPLRRDYVRSPHAYVNQRLQIELKLLMISDVPLETCWAFNERWNNKFCYKVASCWLFLLNHTTMHGSINIKLKISCKSQKLKVPVVASTELILKISTYNSLIFISTDLRAWVDGSLSTRAEKKHGEIWQFYYISFCRSSVWGILKLTNHSALRAMLQFITPTILISYILWA